MELIDHLLFAAAILLSIPVGMVCAECLASLLPRRGGPGKGDLSAPRAALVVLIPAHDEESCIGATIQAVRAQLRPSDRILVIADNCTDQTAAAAIAAGAQVVSRNDATHRGKGFALACGVEYLKTHKPPRMVLMLDADCTPQKGAIDALAAYVNFTGLPAQAIYLLDQPAGNPCSRSAVSSMAFMVRNGVRARGADRLGIPCVLTGSGMAFPWDALQAVNFQGDNLVEDMQLGLDLLLAGWSPQSCDDALILGRLPRDKSAARAQRTRWEHGHLLTALSQAPRLIRAGLKTKKLSLIGMALDICVPPLSLLVILIAGILAASMASGSWLAAKILIAAIASLFICLTIGCAPFGRALSPAISLVSLPLYILWKAPIYLGFILKRQKEWVRTSRTASTQPAKNPSENMPTAA